MRPCLLLIDTDAVALESTSVLFERDGVDVLRAATFQAVHHAIADSAPPVIVIEPVLDGIDGYELCRAILTVYADYRPTVVIASGRIGGKVHEAKARQVGAHAFFERPSMDSGFVERVAQALADAGDAEDQPALADRPVESRPTATLRFVVVGGLIVIAGAYLVVGRQVHSTSEPVVVTDRSPRLSTRGPTRSKLSSVVPASRLVRPEVGRPQPDFEAGSQADSDIDAAAEVTVAAAASDGDVSEPETEAPADTQLPTGTPKTEPVSPAAVEISRLDAAEAGVLTVPATPTPGVIFSLAEPEHSIQDFPLTVPPMPPEIAPRLIPKTRRLPRYPPVARRLGVGGTVVLHAIVQVDGTLRDIEILRDPAPQYGLGVAAAEAVRAWEYEPGGRGGLSVELPVTIRVDFEP